MSEFNKPGGLPDWEQDVPTPAEAERAAVTVFLRRSARDHRKHASALLADSQQSKPDADHWEARAAALDGAAEIIEAGRHWR